MCAQLPRKRAYGEEHSILLLTTADAAAGLHSHSHRRLLLKVPRSLFSLILAFSLVFYLVYHHENGDYAITHHQNEEHFINQLQNRDYLMNQDQHHADYSIKHHGNGDYAINWHQSGENPQEEEDPIINPHQNGDHFINPHQNGDDIINPHQNADHFTNPHQNIDLFSNLHDHVIDQNQNVDATYDHVLAPQKVKMMHSQTDLSAHNRATSSSHTKARRKLQMARGPKVNIFLKIFQDLLDEGLLKIHHKVLCLGVRAGEEVIALKKQGLKDVIGIDLFAPSSHSEPQRRSTFKQHFADESFDFAFTKVFDNIPYPVLFVAEIERTLKAGGFAAMHVSLNVWRNRFMSSEPGHRIKPVTLLFRHSEIVYVSTAYAPGLDTIIVFKKSTLVKTSGTDMNRKQLHHNASIPQAVVNQLEPLLTKECRKCMEEHLESIKFVPDLWDLDKHDHHVYVDMGSHDFNHSWFEKHYPKNGHQFSIFAIDAGDSSQTMAGVTFSQNAAWTRNETNVIEKALSSGQSDYHDRAGVQRKGGDIGVLTVQGLDFAAWLKRTVLPDDFVVVQMDVKGMELELIFRMLEMGTIYLIDELFLVCHHHIDEVGAPYERPFADCLTMYEILRSNGVAVHQWW